MYSMYGSGPIQMSHVDTTVEPNGLHGCVLE